MFLRLLKLHIGNIKKGSKEKIVNNYANQTKTAPKN